MNTSTTVYRESSETGFSFIEVMIALSILLVGSVSTMSLFFIGVQHQTERRIESRVLEVKEEIDGVVRDAVNSVQPGKMPSEIKGHELSIRGYTVDVIWTHNPALPAGATAGPMAHPILKYRGNPVRTLKPIPLTRATLDPRGRDSEGN